MGWRAGGETKGGREPTHSSGGGGCRARPLPAPGLGERRNLTASGLGKDEVCVRRPGTRGKGYAGLVDTINPSSLAASLNVLIAEFDGLEITVGPSETSDNTLFIYVCDTEHRSSFLFLSVSARFLLSAFRNTLFFSQCGFSVCGGRGGAGVCVWWWFLGFPLPRLGEDALPGRK